MNSPRRTGKSALSTDGVHARLMNRTSVKFCQVHCRKAPAKWLLHRSDLGESRILGRGIRRLRRVAYMLDVGIPARGRSTKGWLHLRII
jgi:hypothetical protein